MPSARLLLLETRIRELRRLLLPHRFDPTGSYKDSERVRARAVSFRVLAHAELEAYFEDRAVGVAKAAQKAWEDNGHLCTVSIHLLGFSGEEMLLPPESLRAPDANKEKAWAAKISLDARLSKATAAFVRRVSQENHGIKERNILSMLLPIGFPSTKFDDLLLNALNDFGEARGLVAHTSAASYVTQSADPADEYSRVTSILNELLVVDEQLDQLLSSAAPSPP